MSSVEKKLLCFKINQKNILLLHDKFKKYFYHMNDVKKLKTFLFNVLICSLLTSFGQLRAQFAINGVTAEDQVQFANNPSFEIGNLTIKVKLPSSKTTAEVTVTLPTGIEYVVGSATLGANAASVTYQTSSPVSKPVFTMVGTAPNTEVTFTIKRKITKTATDALAGKLLTDKVKVAITGEGQEEKDSNPYRVTPPVVTVKGVTSVSDAPIGENTTTFGIRNTGVGATRTIFFSVAYPAGITHVSFTPPPLVTLDQVGTVPTGFENAGQPMYRLTKPSGFLGNELVTITQKYQIAASSCGGQLKIGYEPYWGLSATDIFGKNTKVDRNIKVRTYSPKMIQTSDTNKRYFEYGAGLCAATGQKFGTFYTAFKNNSTDAIAYNNRIEKLWQARTYFNLTNFCIIATDGTKIPIAETSNDGNTTKFDFSTNAALLTTNAALTGKDIGFTDEDGDGHLDDLKPGAEIRICYDLVSKGIPFACNALSINPSYTYLYDNACGESIQLLESQGTYRRAYGRINKSIFPAQLLLNAPEKGYLSPGMTSVAAEEQLQGQGGRTNDLRYRYYMQLPSGVGLKNVVFHYTLNDDFTDTTAPIVSIGNIPAGGVLDFTTPNTPPAGVTSGKERLWGHISFELELSNCTGMSSSATIPYKISMMSRNQDGTTFCEIPIVCESASVSTGCSVPCTVKGPEMLSTKVERADNSYGWTDDTMATRVQRANISAEQRRKVLPLDTVEFFAEGKQTDQAAADNLFYYVAVKKNADLLPKSIKVTIGAQETILQASAPGVVTRANDTNGNYYRWDITSALPAGTLAAGQTFSIVATYQASNATENQDLAEQSGITSYFYTLANKNDTAINAQGVHTNALRCGVALIPVFDFGRTGKWNGMNGFILNGCYPINVGGYYIHLGRNQASGSLLYEEYRPGILMKKIVLKMPLAYKITENPEYYYTADAAQARNNTSSSVIIPLNKWVETTEGNKRVYTYTNPTNTADPYFLRPGMIAARTYNEWLKVMVQASCKSKEFTTGTDADKLAAARAADEVGYYQIEAEDLYYHYADNPTPPSTNIANNSVFLLSAKPQLLMAAQGQGSTIRANKNEQSTVIALEARNNEAPNTWISIPDVTGVEVLGLEEVNDAAGTTVVRTLTPETNITGEKMFFLNQTVPVGLANQKYYRLKYKLTNCSQPQLKFKVYAGWNCEGNPTQGHSAACDDTFLEYTVNIAQSKKDIEVGGNPTSLTMCAKTPFSYIVKSTDEGDIFGANLVVTQQPGIVISDVKVEYPLNSGKVYNTSTPVDGKIIGVTTVGGKTTYQLFDILTDGSLPGSVSTNVEDEQKFKVTFNVQPDCDFVAGSSFAIDLEGNNLCGVPAIGPKIVENVAGIAGATVNDYNMLLSSINYQIGTNANACDSGAIYKVKVVVNATPSNPLFTVGNDARLHIRFPQSYDIQNSDITIDRSAFPQANPSSSWADPTVESRGVVGGENEIIMKVPAGMKDTHYFEVMVKIKQKANTAVSCTDERDLKVLTTDKITTVFCSTLGANCPALIVSTSPEKKAKIENKRASLSLADVKVSSTVQGNKEKLTVKYKVTNAATAEALYNGSLKVSLYHDVNGNGLVDAGDTFLKDNTQNENIAIGATSPERSFTYVADQSEVCRLLLAIKDNYCLCDNVVSLATPPAEITGLISDATICESESKMLTYVAAPAPVYQAYTWEAVSPANALDYLSATNTALPTFHYTGAKLTTTTEFKYKLKVKRTNGCESSQEVKLTVKPAPSITTQPTAPTNPYCAGTTTVAALSVVANDHGVAGTLSYEWYESTTNAYNGTPKGSGPTFIPPTNADGIKYYYVKVKNTGCGETLSNIVMVKTNATPTQPTVDQDQAAGCGTVSTAKVTNRIVYDVAVSFVITKAGTPVSATVASNGSINGISEAGTYVIKAVKDGCESAGTTFTIADKLPAPATPTPTATQSFCNSATIADLAPQGTDIKWYDAATGGSLLTSTTALVHNNKYYVAKIQGSCESSRAEVTVKIISLAQPTLTATAVAPTCTAVGKAKITNYDSDATYTFTKADGTAVTETITIAADGIVTGLVAGSYKVKASKDGCEATSADFQIADKLPTPATPTPTATQSFCNSATIADLAPQGTDIKWYDAATGGSLLTSTTALVHNNKYYVAKIQGSCESSRAEVTVKIISLAQPTLTATAVAPTCTAEGKAKITNHDSDATYTFTKADGTAVTETITIAADGIITGLVAGSYKVKASKDGCEATSASFVIQSKQAATTTTNPVGATYVKGATATPLTVTAIGEGTLSYQWFEANSATATGTAVGSNSASYTPSTATVGSKFYYVEVTGTCGTVKSAVAEIKVTALAPTIVANDDPDTSVAKGGEVEVLSNDRLNGNPVAPTDVDITIPNNGGLTGLTVDSSTGKLKVPNTAAPGTYTVTYQICVAGGTTTCDTAKVKITVTSTPPPTITANDDPDTSVAKGGEVEVLSNDRLNGNPVASTDVDITIPNNGGLTGLTVDSSTGKLKVPNTAAPGTYTVTYQICVAGGTSTCDTAKVKITVEVPTLALKAVDDDFGKIPNAVDYTTTNTVFSTGVDTMEGVVGNLSPERDVVLTPGAQPHENITMNPNGSITVKRGTPKGTYTYEYTICQKDVPTNCDKAKVSFEVIEAHIFAKDDGVWEVGTEGALTPSVLNNDILGERVGIAPSEVDIQQTQGKAVVDKTLMEMNKDGRISVKKNIPEGTYTYYYTITENANTANTSSASVTIRVVSFSAQDDEFDITNDKTKEFKTESVLKNDELNKKKNPSPVDDVIFTKGEAKDAERNPTNALTMNEDGTITIAPNTPDGVYTYTYKICKKSPPTECKSAEAVIKLLPALIANDDDFTANPINPLVKEGIAGNVLDNDRYADGNALEHLDKVEITMLEGQESRANIEPNGNVVIPQGAPAGEYTLKYNLCMKDHPTICAEAKVKIVILEDKPIVIHNGISANGDGVNDGFIIEHIEGYPKNNLKIFNRWGVLVYEKDGYTNSEPFDGHSNGRATISAESKLPQGTYYYILEYQDTAEQTHTKKGWLYLKY